MPNPDTQSNELRDAIIAEAYAVDIPPATRANENIILRIKLEPLLKVVEAYTQQAVEAAEERTADVEFKAGINHATMSPTQSDKTVEEILGTLINRVEWAVEVPGAVTINRRLENEARAEAIAALTAREKRMVQPVVEAFTNKGSHPEYHDQQMRRLETEWSSLYFAVRQLTHRSHNDE